MRKIILISTISVFSLVIYGCQTSEESFSSFEVKSSQPIGELMPRIAKLANTCWAASGKPFASYRVSSELNSLSGQPRVLLVRKTDAQGLPALVVLGQKSGDGTQLSVFGRLLGESSNNTSVSKAVRSWAEGKDDCG
jgi:hypothetical protein